MKKAFLSFLVAMGIIFSFVSCAQTLDPDVTTDDSGSGSTQEPGQNPNPDPDPTPEVDGSKIFLFDEEKNPEYDSRTQALDTIFNPDVLGQMVLVFDRSEWNKHLEYCDVDIEHEESVKARGFYFTKDNKEWFFKDIGFRIRGNTSRRIPQEFSKDENGVCTYGKYIQAHFALDFEEWVDDDTDKKLADSMKGLILKRFKDDSTYSREIYGYNLFRKNGIWIAPRAAYTTLKIQIVDDLDLDKDGDTKEFETVDYGVYGMIEEIKKQFLKERTTKVGGGKLEKNDGNLWKCTWKGCKPNFVTEETNAWGQTHIGEESIEPVKDENGNVIQFKKETFTYDYKSDDTFEEGKTQLLAFMEELNNLPTCNENSSADDIQKVKDFYTNKMDGDLFLRTYAINVILGMNDDYWVNNNNFYFYFDTDGKAYFIPYDYDNILGVSCVSNFDVGTKNPMEWGSLTDEQHPLIQKILNVPEYMDLYKSYLDLYSNEQSYFDDDKSIAQITNWQSMIQNYINSPDLEYKDTTSVIEDKVADWSSTFVDYKIYTPGDLNYFTVRQKAIKSYLNPSSEKLTLTINAGEGTFESGKKTMACEFEMLETIQEVISRNNIGIKFTDNGSIYYAYEKDGYYYYPDCFVDEKGNEVAISTALFDSIVLNVKYKKWIPVVLNFNGGMWNDESSINKYVMEGGNIGNDYIPYKEGFVFIGWTATKDGTDYVESIGDKNITLYAKWVSQDEAKPLYEYSSDNTEVTFIFRPTDFGYNWPSSANYTVRLMSEATGWSDNGNYYLTKQDDGTYTITLKYSEIEEGFGWWPGFKFYVKETDDWLGPNKYNAVIAPEQIIYGDNPNDPDFRFEKIRPKLTLDLNGGNIDGSTDAISFPTNEIQGASISWVFEEYGYSNPKNGDFIFAGWTYTKDGQDFTTYIPYGIATLYARWVEAVECVLTVNAGEHGYFEVWNEETSVVEQTQTREFIFTAGNKLWDVPEFSYPSPKSDENGMYQFLYFVDEAGNEIYSDTILTGSTTITAVYEYKLLITITLNPNGGSYWSYEEQDYVTDVAQYSQYEGYGLPCPKKDGCVFDGWYDTVSNERVYECSSKYTSLIAYWIDVFSNADIIGNMTYNAGQALTKEDDVTYSYKFKYLSDMAGIWGAKANQIAFKLRPNRDWDGTDFGSYKEVTLDENETYCGQDCGDIVCSNLVDGSTYKITFRLEGSELRVGVSTVQ